MLRWLFNSLFISTSVTILVYSSPAWRRSPLLVCTSGTRYAFMAAILTLIIPGRC